MIIWGIVWGAVLGSMWPGYGDFGVFLGAVLGFFAGFSLRWVVRSEVAAAQKKLRPQAATAPAPAAAAAKQVAEVEDDGGFKDFEDTSPQAAAPSSTTTTPTTTPTTTATTAPPPLPVTAADNEAAWASELPPAAQSAPASVAAAPKSVTRPAPAQPNAIEQALTAAQNWFLGGNTIVRVGLVILFIGLSFLARYAASAGLLPVEFRLAAIGAAAIALLAVGFRKRHDKPGFALALQGAGVAVMYLTVFAAFRLYGLLDPLPSFALMIIVCALSCALALLQNSRALAVAAFAGGFAVPLLLSTGQGSHVGLFSYYTVLNLAILFIAYKRSWRILNVVGFIATFGVATAWGVLKYAPEHYASAQPFLIGLVLIYLFTAILYARNTPTKLGNAVDTMLVFGTPLAGFGLQAGLVQGMELGTALSALGFAALYLLTATVLVRRGLASYRLLIECFIAVGVGFATLAVPLALDAKWTSVVWALEGAGAFWVGMRQARWMPRAFGLLLQGVAAMAFLGGMDDGGALGSPISAIPFGNPAFIGAMLIALPALQLAWWLRKPLPHSESSWAKAYAGVESQLSAPVYLYGFFFWCLAWLLEISRRVPALQADEMPQQVFSDRTTGLLMMLAVVASAALSMLLGLKKQWAVATWPARITVGVLALGFVVQVGAGYRVLAMPAWAVWPVVLVLHYWMLRQSDRQALAGASGQSPYGFLHAASAWLVTFLLADCLWSGIGKAELWRTSWAGVVLLVSAIAVLMLLAVWAGRANSAALRQGAKWPLNPHAQAYYWYAALPLAVLVFWGALAASVTSSGRTAPLPYIPLLNPTDLTLALALGALVFWRRVLVTAAPPPGNAGWVTGRNALVSLALLVFVAVNTVWLRVAHHFFGVRWDADALFESFVVQTGYAILWTLLALTLMVLAHRRVQRPLWLVGAGLLGLVVVKLLLIDLSNAGGAERIVAFIAVGILMLVVGYFAPLPPKAPSAAVDAAPPDALELKEAQ
ncbi:MULTISPECIES: DUF2339 domain-containing protein [unclassified Polaromonas]|uniref:DUF2339 domain-containing protein n=1 Tax=unclassified Polaromonas TaxID=2638319 RepID=UPI000F08E1B7|nr:MULTISPECIES: DUF2339 domain-containing protein [unclassified Polaromonas]AYQ28273.1 DUF2339 domain-containing protein [Polaromonas sp. SP1]QGJ20606.1 DUF2339 domain-containing protein [Polaromonas sp. Pch-P]